MTTETTLSRIAAVRPELPEEDVEQILARILSSPRTIADDPWRERHHRPTRRAVLAGAGTVAVAAGSAAVALVLSGSSLAVRTHPSGGLRLAVAPKASGTTVRARLIDALTNASRDVIETRTAISDGQRIDQWSNGAGTTYRSVVSAHHEEPTTEALTTISSSGTTSTVLYPATHTWDVEHGTSTQPAQGITAASIEAQVSSGALRVVGAGGTIEGHDTTELALPASASMVEYLYVDSSSYLPVRLTLAPPAGVSGPSSEEDWTYYAPTRAALAELTMPIPGGYTQTSTPPTTTAPSNASGSAS